MTDKEIMEQMSSLLRVIETQSESIKLLHFRLEMVEGLVLEISKLKEPLWLRACTKVWARVKGVKNESIG
jgi:hypothetical protein